MNIQAEDRPVDQIYCEECGRPIIVWADVELSPNDLICQRCKKRLTPEWEY
jgi:hypothetical protein